MAQSFNHQFPELQDSVYKRYKKTVPYIIGGTRTNPHKQGESLSWQLKTDETNFDFTEQKIKTFSYDDEVLEIYSEVDDRVFRRSNRKLFENGLLIEYGSAREDKQSPNNLTDNEVKEIAALKQIPALRKAINEITSKATLQRILDAANNLERSVKVIEAIKERMEEV